MRLVWEAKATERSRIRESDGEGVVNCPDLTVQGNKDMIQSGTEIWDLQDIGDTGVNSMSQYWCANMCILAERKYLSCIWKVDLRRVVCILKHERM